METTQLEILVTEYLDRLEQYNQHNITDNSDKLMAEMQQTRKIMHLLGYSDFSISMEIQYQKRLGKIILSKGDVSK